MRLSFLLLFICISASSPPAYLSATALAQKGKPKAKASKSKVYDANEIYALYERDPDMHRQDLCCDGVTIRGTLTRVQAGPSGYPIRLFIRTGQVEGFLLEADRSIVPMADLHLEDTLTFHGTVARVVMKPSSPGVFDTPQIVFGVQSLQVGSGERKDYTPPKILSPQETHDQQEKKLQGKVIEANDLYQQFVTDPSGMDKAYNQVSFKLKGVVTAVLTASKYENFLVHLKTGDVTGVVLSLSPDQRGIIPKFRDGGEIRVRATYSTLGNDPNPPKNLQVHCYAKDVEFLTE